MASIGKGYFVMYFQYFNNPKYSHQELIDILLSEEGYEKTACATRVSKSRSIINEGITKEAFNIIISSNRLDNTTVLKTKKILKDL